MALASIVMVGAPSRTLTAEQWPQWRGPMLNGVSGEKNLPVSWSTTENVTWKLAMPERSGSTPIVWGDHVFLNVGEGPTSRSGRSIGRPARCDGSGRSAAAIAG